MKIIALPIFLISGMVVFGQEAKKDTVKSIKEVSLTGFLKQKIQTDVKLLASVDEYLVTSENISFVKRGAYAWEPLLNNMSSERSQITIDGMHIFGACADKMDPVISYVETNNLSKIDIKSGQEGSAYGATISGYIDLKRKRIAYSNEPQFGGNYQTGFELNNRQYFNLADVYYSSPRWIADGSVSYRTAQNYKDGNGDEVQFSQYKKINTSVGLGYKTSDLSSLKVDAIFDVAKDVGYPALPMDVWLARALITSASYKQLFEESLVSVWETKFYFNAVEHYMDDTKRPNNPVHMDMPGWSTTYGLLSKVHLRKNSYSADIQLNAYMNESTAEMTMYPQDRSRRTMFTFTWPEVTTKYAGLSINNQWETGKNGVATFGGTLGVHYNHSEHIYVNRIMHPDAPQSKTRLLPNLYGSYQLDFSPFSFTLGVGYGHRAPSVSEAYGYYIFNSFDRYDYIGNPDLKNEISYETNFSVAYDNDENLVLEAKANYFLIENYIIGKILKIGFPMNPLSVGVKGYTSLDRVSLLNISLNFEYDFLEKWQWRGSLNYAEGRDRNGGNLPFIRPLSYQTVLQYQNEGFSCQASFNGDFTQTAYSPEYGEDRTPAYIIYNISADYIFPLGDYSLQIQAGAENLFNKYYSTYADWGNIPRLGRNIFMGLKFRF